MDTLKLDGRITENGELQLNLPEGLPSGEVHVTIEFSTGAQTPPESTWELRPRTEEEIRDALTFKPATGAEIMASGVFGTWSDMGIADSAVWVEELRHKEENSRWR